MQMSIEFMIGLITDVVVPILLWGWNVTMKLNSIKRTDDTLKAHMLDEASMHKETIDSMKLLRQVIRELSHYTRWAAEKAHGAPPPPYVRQNGDD